MRVGLRSSRLVAGIALLGASLCLAACVRSKVIVTSEPAEAMITMNGVNLGTTPLEQPFTWYWYYDFVATKEGYVADGKRVRFRAPPWLWPGFDLLMEAMPFYVNDTKKVHLMLAPVDTRPAPQFAEESEPSPATP